MDRTLRLLNLSSWTTQEWPLQLMYAWGALAFLFADSVPVADAGLHQSCIPLRPLVRWLLCIVTWGRLVLYTHHTVVVLRIFQIWICHMHTTSLKGIRRYRPFAMIPPFTVTALNHWDRVTIVSKADTNICLGHRPKVNSLFSFSYSWYGCLMGIWISKLFNQYFGNKEVRILVLGLDNAGKTSILCNTAFTVFAKWLDRMQLDEVVSTVPTIGFNVETLKYKNLTFQVWDLGGQTTIRPYWRCYYPNTGNTDGQISSCRCRYIRSR